MSFVDQFTPLGYDVSIAINVPGEPALYLVEGYGEAVYAEADDTALLQPFLDGHQQRVLLFNHPELRRALNDLSRRGIEWSLDFDNQQVDVTLPGDTTATAMTLQQFKSYVDGLPAYNRWADVRQQIQAATTVPQLKAALGALIDRLPS